MVKEGDFEVRLVDAKTKKPFRERHVDSTSSEYSRDVFVEVEPDQDYFISIQKIGCKSKEQLYCDFRVDDKDLGYYSWYESDELDESPIYKGLWTRVNGVESHRALQFTRPKISYHSCSSVVEGSPKKRRSGSPKKSHSPSPRKPCSDNKSIWMGSVEIGVYAAVYTGRNYAIGNHRSQVQTRIISASEMSTMSRRKILRSAVGTTIERKKPADPKEALATFKPGEKLHTITLKYCTALGLIAVGVLPKPPLWDYHRMKFPAKRSLDDGSSEEALSSDEAPAPGLFQRKSEVVEDQDEGFGRKKRVEIFELRELAEDDEKKEEE